MSIVIFEGVPHVVPVGHQCRWCRELVDFRQIFDEVARIVVDPESSTGESVEHVACAELTEWVFPPLPVDSALVRVRRIRCVVHH